MKRILLVDDDLDIQLLCKSMLSGLGHSVTSAGSADEALTLLRQGKELFDLLIVDVEMPEKSGFDFLRELKIANNYLGRILMLTSRRTPQDVIKARELGAIDYICKPIQKQVFLPKIQAVLGINKVSVDEFNFARGESLAQLCVLVTAEIETISENGLTFGSNTGFEVNSIQCIQSSIFSEMGITAPFIHITESSLINREGGFGHRVKGSFIGLKENELKKIRQWVCAQSMAA